MVKELIVHLGDCKTGTTALQSCLATGGYEVPHGRICYPARHNHNLLALPLSTLPEASRHARFAKARYAQVAAALEASDADWGVISAELYEFVPPEVLKDALDKALPGYRDRVRLVSYVRPHHARIVSGYAEALKKSGGPSSLNIYAKRILRKGPMYYPRFSRWREVYGDAFHLRPFLRDRLVNGDIVADFLAFVCGSPNVKVTKTPRDNSALTVPELAMMREIHARLGTMEKGRNPSARLACRQLGWQLAPMLGENRPEPGPKLGMHRSCAELVRDSFTEDAAMIDADFFEGTPFSDALHAATDTFARPPSLDIEKNFSPEEIGRIRAFADLTRRVIDADPQHFFQVAMPEHERSDLPGTKGALTERSVIGPRANGLRQMLRRLMGRGT